MSLSANLILQRMDWALLREQKNYCLNEEANNYDARYIYGGIVALMDQLQDAAVACGMATVEQVFGEDTSAHEEAEHLAELERGYAQDRI